MSMARPLKHSEAKSLELAKPFLKWAGGKTQLLSQLDQLFPKRFKRYTEPFAGSAAVFFHLRNMFNDLPATLVDSNLELMNCYRVVRDSLEKLLPLLDNHQKSHDKKYYYEMRETDVDSLDEVARAARLIYLNKTCYNGLYRVNRKGKFNVPMGSYINPRIFNLNTLSAASEALQGVELRVYDFSLALEEASEGDFVYFDPPYFPISKTSSFTGYSVSNQGKVGFGVEEHGRLAKVFNKLSKMGCMVMLSNSDCDFVRRLYRGFRITKVSARRSINSKADRRGAISELVITNF